MTPAEKAPIFAVIPPPVWIAIYIGLAAMAARAGFHIQVEQLHSPMAGIVLVALALGLAMWSAALFRREGTQIHPASPTNNKLVVRGPYRFTRNPIYLAMLVLSLGLAIWIGGLTYFAVPVISFLTNDRIVIPYEERKMEAQFGEAFRAYKARVRRWI